MSSPLDLRKFVTAEFIFGNGARLLAGRYAKNLAAKKILIVTDPGIVKVGLVDELSDLLNNENLEYEIYDNVNPNPRDHEVMEGAEIYSSEECNLIIALGGGSPMDCAKGIGIVSSNNQHILEFEGVDQVSMPSPPLICIPTTAGTSADVSQFAIILDTKRQVKIAIISKATVPDAALIDPGSTMTMNIALTANTGFDALIHSIEAYVSNASSHITDLHALDSIKLVSENIIPVLGDLQNIELRSKMMMGSLEGGLAFSNASLGLIHAMAHSLGGLKDLAHGECNAILLEHVIDFNFDSEIKKYTKISQAMGINIDGLNHTQVKEELISHIKNLKETAKIRGNLSNLGVKEEDIEDLARMALNDPCVVTNPVRPTVQDIEEIFRNAL
ncbi:alcohol dehydrogenase-like regulatory protein ErcA [Methanobacterium alcaliphilum]|uniref:alcohol dehydrogenase-like regulatory protein ErcA n=1 Tax=Methanobacterium alcaliphilum TaxID=392018 RepID=UPI00200AFC69|nr:alcohol dehydrogenase-like regulatory protein ErcA [Methanobacterium alcaliphilum]MCK9150343.1 iron-containing alcohol dehydrogenase [Methanobacterium alcaliphilum]